MSSSALLMRSRLSLEPVAWPLSWRMWAVSCSLCPVQYSLPRYSTQLILSIFFRSISSPKQVVNAFSSTLLPLHPVRYISTPAISHEDVTVRQLFFHMANEWCCLGFWIYEGEKKAIFCPYPLVLKKLWTHFCLAIAERVLTVHVLHQVKEK